MKLSVIIPTIGRESLQAALSSCETADEVIVVENHDGDHGYQARTRGMAQATGTHLAFLDDDDIYTPDAVDAMREAACDRPVIFRMDDPLHGVIWRRPELTFGNVGTPMFLVPNDPRRLGVWEPHVPGLKQPGGDFTFITGCVDRMGAPVWREETVAIVDPTKPRRLSVTVVTPWLNHPDLAADYWQAIDATAATPFVVDNCSDQPVPRAAVRMDENRGFSGASNVGLHAAETDAVLFLNNDIAMTDPNWLNQIVDALEPGVLVGAELRYDDHADVDGHKMPYLDGWCLAGMTDDLLEIGGWDETFDEPSYFGDNDLCLRARAHGIGLREVKVGLRHKLNQTAGRNAFVQAVTLANRQRYIDRARQLIGVSA